ncbi:MAG: histidine triad nucleotide-binding protein [Candidatus Nanopelagicales bacterium]|jgi:histidine triad (HIT) family protein|nr:histidine triad nucleotide-binding protein [Candidatus Nanopelagicales bacterium]
MSDCLFCKIVKKEIPCDLVLESENYLAFKDIDPKAPIHILVIPKKHFEDITELSFQDLDLTAGLMEMVSKVAQSENLEKGFRVVLNTGPDAGQSVQHVHAHVLGGRSLTWPPG